MDKMKKVCCACLSTDKELFKLLKVSDGLNILCSLLQCDPEAFREGILKNSSHWMVCSDCKAAISNIKKFRDQVCFALKQLRILTNDKYMEISTLSNLKTHANPVLNNETDVFIDCGANYDIKKEDIFDNQEWKASNTLTQKENTCHEENCTVNFDNICSEKHLKIENNDKAKSNANDNVGDEIELRNDFNDEFVIDDLTIETKAKKKLKNNEVKKKKKINSRKTNKILCSECGKTFENKGAKWKHVQITHKEGHKCVTCGKVFSFKFNLQRHQRTHSAPAPLTPCSTCGKLVSSTRLALHARTHTSRPGAACVPCRRQFVTRATYEAHLRNSRAHADGDIFRYPCQSCDKKYRSRGELRDHVAYTQFLATRRSLARHVRRAHEGLREGGRDKMCDYCGRTFRDKKSLCEHIWRHTGARPLACALCPRAFRQRAALYEHTKRLHPNG